MENLPGAGFRNEGQSQDLRRETKQGYKNSQFNKKYWKIPIVYAAIGTSIYSYDFNHKKYWDYRNAYKSRKAGYKNDPYQNFY